MPSGDSEFAAAIKAGRWPLPTGSRLAHGQQRRKEGKPVREKAILLGVVRTTVYEALKNHTKVLWWTVVNMIQTGQRLNQLFTCDVQSTQISDRIKTSIKLT